MAQPWPSTLTKAMACCERLAWRSCEQEWILDQGKPESTSFAGMRWRFNKRFCVSLNERVKKLTKVDFGQQVSDVGANLF